MWKLHRGHNTSRFSKQFLPVYHPHVPQQSNGTDCGLYLLHYIEKFVQKPTHNRDEVCIFF